MMYFAIVETDNGLVVVQYPPGADLEEIARDNSGTLVDPGPFASYEDAYDAILGLEPGADDRD